MGLCVATSTALAVWVRLWGIDLDDDHDVVPFDRRPGRWEPQTTRRLQVLANDQSSVESDHDRDTGQPSKPRRSQPEGSMRFTSDAERCHDGTVVRCPPNRRFHTSRRFSVRVELG